MEEKNLDKARRDILQYCQSFKKSCNGCEFRKVVKDGGIVLVSECTVGRPYRW